MTAAPDLELETDAWFRATIGVLWFCGAVYVLLGLGFGALLGTGTLAEDGASPQLDVLWGVLMVLVGGGIGALNFVIAVALQRRWRWGWVAALIVGAMYAPSGCFPFGVVMLYALLRSGVREAYLREAEAARAR